MCTGPRARARLAHGATSVPAHRKFVYRVTHRSATSRRRWTSSSARSDEGGSIGELLGDLHRAAWTTKAAATTRLESAAADNELVKLVNKIIIDAYNQGASDIHIEPYPGKGKTDIRFRKDGIAGALHRGAGAATAARMVTRLKIMCDLDISEKRKPQDGKIKFKKFGPLDIELRVATIPTAGGVEDVVMRILAAGEPIPLDKLGLLAAQPGAPARARSPSPTACSSCAARPARARPPRCTRCWAPSTRPTPRSGPPKTRSKSRRRACARCR